MIIRYVADENKGQALNKPLTSPFGSAYNESSDSAPIGLVLALCKVMRATGETEAFS